MPGRFHIWDLGGPTKPSGAELVAAARLAGRPGGGTVGACPCGGKWAAAAMTFAQAAAKAAMIGIDVSRPRGPGLDHFAIMHSSPPCARFARDTWLYFREIIMPATVDA